MPHFMLPSFFVRFIYSIFTSKYFMLKIMAINIP